MYRRPFVSLSVVALSFPFAACGGSSGASNPGGSSQGASSQGAGSSGSSGITPSSSSSAAGGSATTSGASASSGAASSGASASSGGAASSSTTSGGSSTAAPGGDASVPTPDAAGPLPDGGPADAPAGDGTMSGDAASDASSVVTPPTGNVTCGTSYTNPIKAFTHDPSPPVKDGDTYYLYATCQTTLKASPGCGSVPKLAPFQTSTDKLNWHPAGNAMGALPAWASQLGLSGPPDIWAPDVHIVGGKAYMYYSVSSWGDSTHSAIGLMTTPTVDPAAPGYQWIDQGRVVGAPESGSGVNAIDADLFIDDDGRWWLVYGSFNGGIRLIELDPGTGKAKTPIAPTALANGIGEGSGIIKNNGYYYLFLSTGSCCNGLSSTYQIIYGRATKVTGPYLNRTGGSINSATEHLLPPGSDGNPGQGGQSFFKENNQFYMVYHAYQPPNGDPTLNIRPIYFDANDWVTLDPCKAKGYHP